MRKLTPENLNRLKSFIDTEAIARAKASVATMKTRLVTAKANLDAAANELREAEAISDRAIRGDGDPIAAEMCLEETRRKVTVAEKIVEAANAAVASAEEGHARTHIQAHLPAYAEGVRMRVEAARKADRARAMLAEAQADHDQGTAAMEHGYGSFSIPHAAPSGAWDFQVSTEAAERHVWTAASFDWASILAAAGKKGTDA